MGKLYYETVYETITLHNVDGTIILKDSQWDSYTLGFVRQPRTH